MLLNWCMLDYAINFIRYASKNPKEWKISKCKHTQSNPQIDDKVFIIATYIVLPPLELKPNGQEASTFISSSKLAIPFQTFLSWC